MGDDPETGAPVRVGLAVLQQCGLRWAILAAWAEELHNRGTVVPPHLVEQLESSRARIASGAFDRGELGDALSGIESGLALADAACEPSSVSFWLALPANALADEEGIARLLRLPAVRFHYAGCGCGPAACQGQA